MQVLEFSIPQLIPIGENGAEFFNYFFALPLCFAVILIPIMIVIMLVNRS